MNGLTATTSAKAHDSGPRRAGRAHHATKPVLPGGILGLQRAAGHEAVSKLLESTNASQQLPAHGLPPIVQSVLSRGGGQPLNSSTRVEMESRFGADFRQVRIHTDSQASQSAAAVAAKAYTAGRDVVFGRGNYAPNTREGKRLLAHELAHVIQQSRGGATPNANPNSPLERAANTAAASMANHQGQITVSGASAPGIARQEIAEFGPDETNQLIAFWQQKIQSETAPAKVARYQRFIDNLSTGAPLSAAEAGLKSEEEMRFFYRQIGPAEEKGFKFGRSAPRGGTGSRGATKPDISLSQGDLEVKARDITDPDNANVIIREVRRQVQERREGGRAYAKRQGVILDLRRQNVSRAQITEFVQRLTQATGIPLQDVQVVVNVGQLPAAPAGPIGPGLTPAGPTGGPASSATPPAGGPAAATQSSPTPATKAAPEPLPPAAKAAQNALIPGAQVGANPAESGMAQAVGGKLEKETEKAAVEDAEKKIVGQLGKAGERGLASTAAESLTQGATRKAAGRGAASLVPVAGWAFSVQDIGKGIGDISHGNITMGIGTIGVAGVDMLADLLHLTDVVTAGGGTALSLTIQAWTSAMQMGFEQARVGTRASELQSYIKKTGGLPPRKELMSYYGLNDEDILHLENDILKAGRAPKVAAATVRNEILALINKVDAGAKAHQLGSEQLNALQAERRILTQLYVKFQQQAEIEERQATVAKRAEATEVESKKQKEFQAWKRKAERKKDPTAETAKPSAQAPPLLQPPTSPAQATEFTPLPGMGMMQDPLQRQKEVVKRAEFWAMHLRQEGESLESRMGSADAPSQQEKDKFLRAEAAWREFVTNPPAGYKLLESHLSQLKELLHRFGERLSQIRTRFRG